jgi:hypothetical protein
MIRVAKSQGGERTIITIDGQLSGDYIDIVETCCNQAFRKEGRSMFSLCDVLTIDKFGRALLMRLAAKDMRLLATGMNLKFRQSPMQKRPAGSCGVVRKVYETRVCAKIPRPYS